MLSELLSKNFLSSLNTSKVRALDLALHLQNGYERDLEREFNAELEANKYFYKFTEEDAERVYEDIVNGHSHDERDEWEHDDEDDDRWEDEDDDESYDLDDLVEDDDEDD